MGKTTLARMLPEAVYMNCDLPSVVRRLEDPELFFRSQDPRAVVVLDEVHRLADPSRTLKIASDVFPGIHVLATGSSTLAVTSKFRDTLTGRKVAISLLPVLWSECEEAFGVRDLDRRLLNGGLPEALLSRERDDSFYSEWMDSFYARDIQELFGVRERTGFLNLLRLILRQSSGLVDYSALSRECDLSRPTVKAHLEALSAAYAIFGLRPFHGSGRRELLRRPKAYAFDTGFVAFVRGWRDIRDEDRGLLWEHLVLDTLRTAVDEQSLYYWRDKSGREVDFVVRRGTEVDAIECKVNPGQLECRALGEFRKLYPRGRNYITSPWVEEPYDVRAGNLTLRVLGCGHLMQDLGR